MERSTFSIRWNHHQNHLLTSINYALINKSFVDVTILCANPHPEVGGPVLSTWTFNAHKVSLKIVLTKVFGHFWFLFVLVGPFGMLAIFRKSASWQCSFRTKSNRFAKGYTASRFFSFVEIHVPRYKVDFTKIISSNANCLPLPIYVGQVEVPREDLDNVLKAAQVLKIEGLTRKNGEGQSNRKRKSTPKLRYMQSNKMLVRPQTIVPISRR